MDLSLFYFDVAKFRITILKIMHITNHSQAGVLNLLFDFKEITQPIITCSKLTTETLEQGVKYVQS